MKKIILLTLSLCAVTLVPYTASAQWVAPTAFPPSGNVPAPVNVGTIAQEKIGGLTIGGIITSVPAGYNSLSVKNKTTNQQVLGINPYGIAGQGYFNIWGSKDGAAWLSLITGKDGKVGIGGGGAPHIPAETLDVAGAVKIGSTVTSNPGTIRWTGQDFEGYVGAGVTKGWKSLTEAGSSNLPVCTEGKILKYSGEQWTCGEDIGAIGSIVFGHDSNYVMNKYGGALFLPGSSLPGQLIRRVVTLEHVPSWAGAVILSYRNTSHEDHLLNFYGYTADGKLKPAFLGAFTRGGSGNVIVPLNSRGEFILESDHGSVTHIMVTGLIAGKRPSVPIERITLTGTYVTTNKQCNINYPTYFGGNVSHGYVFFCGEGNQADTVADEEKKFPAGGNAYDLIYLENMIRFRGFPGKIKDACKSLPAVITGASASIAFECI